MRAAKLRTLIAVLGVVVLVAGCAASSTSFAPTPPATPSLVGVSTPTLDPTVTPTPSSMALETAWPTTTPAASRIAGVELVGKTAVTAVDGVRVRSQPRVSDDSFKEEPLLPRGTALYMLDGPVSASGYDWYNVAPLTSRDLPSGWVASASRDGVPWLEQGNFDCPSVPADFRALTALPDGVGLACFPRVPITVRARVLSCECDVDGAWYTPHWFTLSNGELLVDPGVTRVPPDMENWFRLNLDPAGQHPDLIPVGQVVEVTGIFDHPAAATCTRTEMDGEPNPSQGCRLEFAVTKLVVQP